MFAKFIQKLRKNHSFSQGFMAQKIGISRPTYMQIEQGERDLTITEAQKIAALFGMSFEYFIQQIEPNSIINIIAKQNQEQSTKTDVRIDIPQEKADKFKQVLIYILRKVGGNPNIGMTVIYKLLYFIDFDYYEKYEEQLMGLTYIKNHYGPAPLLFKHTIDEMIKKGEIEEIKSKYYKYPQTKYLINPKIEPDLTLINGQEQEHIDWELQRLANLSATELSNLSHKDVPWITATDGKSLEYEAVFYRTAETSVRHYGEDNDEY